MAVYTVDAISSTIENLNSPNHPERSPKAVKDVLPRERWLWENKEALASVMRGLEQARRGELREDSRRRNRP